MLGSARAALLSANPLSNYLLALDFKNGRYRHGGIYRSGDVTSLPGYTYTRSGAKYELDAGGVPYAVADGAPAIVPGVGYWARTANTNKCTNSNANPTLSAMTKSGDAAATLTVVDDTAALAAAGLSGICTSGKVYKLDNSLGTTPAYALPSGPTGNTNQHTVSIYARVTQGTAKLEFSQVGSVNPPTVASASYARYSDNAPNSYNASSVLQFRVLPGAIAYFVLNQMVESSLPGPIIVTNGAAATVGADALSFTSPITADQDFIWWTVVNYPAFNGVDQAAGELFGDVNNRLMQYVASSQVYYLWNAAAGTAQPFGRASPSPTVGRSVLLFRNRADKQTLSVKRPDGTISIPAETTAAVFPTGLSKLMIGHNNGSTQGNGVIEFIGIKAGTFSDTDLTNLLSAA